MTRFVSLDMNELVKQKVYLVYGLIDPRTNKVCYIGMTRQKLSKRLQQHNNPIESNLSIVAKVARRLQRDNLKFESVILQKCKSQEHMESEEIRIIAEYRSDKRRIYNIQDGGKLCDYTKFAESTRRQKETTAKRRALGLIKPLNGEANGFSILTEKEVLEIYYMMKKGYTNQEIHVKYATSKISAIKALRSGQNWKWLWDQNFTEPIPSLASMPSGYPSYVKIKIVEYLDKGYSIKQINRRFKNLKNSDLKRISERKLWIPVWKFYDQYVKGIL